MPAPSGKKYTPCAEGGERAITTYRPTQDGKRNWYYTWRKDARKTRVVRVPVELAEYLSFPGNAEKVLDILQEKHIIKDVTIQSNL